MSVSTGRINILHVDDDPDFADLAATYLEREDERFAVETATSASEGLERLAGTAFDCIVSDYDMPGRDGIEFLEAVREEHPDLPFVLFTGKGSEEVASEAISAGVSDYLQKGPDTDRYSLLANRIDNLVSQYEAETELATRAEQQRRLAELGRRALAGASPDALFEAAVTAVVETLGTEYAQVLEYRPGEGDLLLRAGAGWRDGLVGAATVGAGEDSQAGYTLRSDAPVVVADLRTEDRFQESSLLADHGIVSGVSAVIGSAEEPWGVLGTHTTERTGFTDDDATFVQNVANVLATAIERNERETELRRKTRAIAEAPVGITMSDPSREDNPITYANEEFQRLTGYDESAAVGRNCRFLQGDRTAEEPIAAMREAVDAREPVTVELRNYRKDGTEFWNRVTIAPVTDEAGTLTNFVGFQEDVTDRKERERERERTLEFLQTLYEVATDTNAGFEEKLDRLLTIGHEKLGLPYGHLTRIELADDAAGGGTQTIIEASGDHELLQPGDSCPLSESYCRRTIQTDGLMEIEDASVVDWGADPAYETFDLGCYIGTRVTVDDELYGTVFFASRSPREEPFDDAERTFIRLLSQLVSYELERDQVWSELRRKNERLEEFASVLSHDLQTPLNVAEGRVELAREECDSEHLDAVARAHGRMDALIDNLLTVARQGEGALDVERVDLASLVSACWRGVDTDRATISVDTDRTLRADRSRLQQLLENLLRNAVQHGGPAVTVTVGELDDGFYVADDGPGIPEGAREAVFDTGYSTAEDGTGVGLGIVERVAKTHGWEVRVTEGFDGGARFEITGVSFTE